MPVFKRYSYEPLSSQEAFRLIILDPAPTRSADLSCLLLERRHRTSIAGYCAVSYAWDECNVTRTLKIRSGTKTAHSEVGPSVDALLRVLRAPDVPVCLWIDAICINQEDEVEKAQQIPLMSRIFGEAEKVHIWLGEADYSIPSTFAFFREASRLPVGAWTQWTFAGQLCSLIKKHMGGEPVNGLFCLSEFFGRRWFSRRWIIQEAGLSRNANVHSGYHSIPLHTMIVAAQRIQSLDFSWYQVAMVALLGSLEADMDILRLLWDFHEADCRDPKDRIGALLGLAASVRPHLQYNAEWPDLYRQLATYILESGNDDMKLVLILHLFEFGPIGRPARSYYPSWVPDWSRTRRRLLPYNSDIRNPDTFETMPVSPGHSAKSFLKLENQCLNISWDSSLCGLTGRLVTFATKIDSPPTNKAKRAENVVAVISELFQSCRGSGHDLLAVCWLVETVMTFRHNTLDHQLNEAFFHVYAQRMADKFRRPTSEGATAYSVLRGLDAILREFTLLRLKDYESQDERIRTYGIGPAGVTSNDIMVPLWHLGFKYTGPVPVGTLAGKRIYLVTMIAVKPVKPQASQDARVGLDGDRFVLRGTIIGPAVCVVIENARKPATADSDGFKKAKAANGRIYSMLLE